ncbi:MAG: UpxY family transcription antiterminator [Tidjanibacter sp.]|nr:UpxY family transcription antiterminator [Tidjanibacter sp.]
MAIEQVDSEKHWYALRDLKRANAILPAYKQLAEEGFEVFTPMESRFYVVGGKRIKREVPVMRDLVFVNDCRKRLDPIVAKTPTLQYRFKKGGKQGEPIIVPDDDMERFIGAVQAANNPKFYSAEEVTPLMCGRTVRMVGGALDGYEGILQTVRGSKTKHLVITLPSLVAVSVEIKDEFVEVM